MSEIKSKTILAKIHFLDGVILEKEFQETDGPSCDDYSPAPEVLRIFLEHTPWLKLDGNEFRPASQVEKVTWEEPISKESLEGTSPQGICGNYRQQGLGHGGQGCGLPKGHEGNCGDGPEIG